MKFAAQDLQSEVSEWAKLYRLIPKFRNNQDELFLRWGVGELRRAADKFCEIPWNLVMEFSNGVMSTDSYN